MPIAQLVEKNRLLSIQRENYNVLEFQEALSNASFYQEGLNEKCNYTLIFILFVT